MKVLDKDTKKQRLLLKIQKLQYKKSIKEKEYTILENTINNINTSIELLTKQMEEVDTVEPKVKTIAQRKETEPHIYCKICRKTFFGISIENYKKLLLAKPMEALKTDYHKHRELCDDTCENCGAVFETHMGKRNHKCIVAKPSKCSYVAKQINNNIVTTIDEVQSESEDELEPWYDSKTRCKYYVNNNNDVFDETDEQVGYRYQNRLIHTDDECYEDFVDSQD